MRGYSGPESRSPGSIEIRAGVEERYPDIYTHDALRVIEALARFDQDRKEVMEARMVNRASRYRDQERTQFLDPDAMIPRTDISVQDARSGNFVGATIPPDLQRQWIQGTGPAAKPNVPLERSIRNCGLCTVEWCRRLDVRRGRCTWSDKHYGVG